MRHGPWRKVRARRAPAPHCACALGPSNALMPPAAISGRAPVAVASPRPRPRRPLRLLAIILGVLAALLVTGYALLPLAACSYVRGDLPKRWAFPRGELALREVGAMVDLAYSGNRPELQLLAPCDYASDLASRLSGWWLPPYLARAGQHAEGILLLRDLRDRPFTWQVLVGGLSAVPTACLAVEAVDLNHFLLTNAQTTLPLPLGDHQVLKCTYVVDGGHIEDDDLPAHASLERRSRVVAHGSIIVDAAGWRKVVRVRRLAGHATTTFTQTSAGLTLTMVVAIDEADADLISLPVVGDLRPFLIKQLEIAANQGLKDGLEKVILPAWFPVDLAAAVEVVGDGARQPPR